MEGDRKSQFKLLLLYLAENISEKDFKNLKFLCNEFISKSRMEHIKDAIELFEELENRHVIKFDKIDKFKELIEKSTNQKRKLIENIDRYERGECFQTSSATISTQPLTQGDQPLTQGDQPTPQVQPLRKDLDTEIDLLINNLGRNWKFFLRYLNVPDSELDLKLQQHPHDIKEAIHASFRYWLSQIPDNKSKEEIIKDLIKALKDLGRNDLIDKLEN